MNPVRPADSRNVPASPADSGAVVRERMVSGGDHRQGVDPVSGLSRYLVSAQPREVVPLGSCTASSPSPLGWRAAADATLLDPVAVCADVRARLREHFGVPERGEVVLTPSGTDALYVLSALIQGRVHHVVVGSAELGGGTMAASLGRSISPIAPHGESADGIAALAARCTAIPVELRERGGLPRTTESVDAEVRAAVEAGLARGEHVVLTVVTHSKTGLCAPSEATLDWALRLPPGRLTVLIDAAQGRLEPADARSVLERGAVVLLTGSKLWGGPAFSGALLLPASLAGDPGVLPGGLESWVAAASLPEAWSGARSGLVAVNEGLAVRWSAALAEIEATLAIPASTRAAVLEAFEAARDAEGPLAWVPAPLHAHGWMTGMSRRRTIHTFAVPGDLEHAKSLHAAADAAGFHLGQPVALGPDASTWGLRVALGAPLLRARADDADSGAAWFREAFAEVAAVLRGAS
ncbi:MAG: hypothetical protein R3F61_08945 [Myxococcota bacterium]